MNRALAALTGGMITFFILIFIENQNFSIIVALIFGSEEDDFVNLHSLILIIAMMIIVVIANESGLFQFIAIKLILLSKGKPIRLMVILCTLTMFMTAFLNNILAVIILIPLTITISRILNIDPIPYIITQAILIKVGSTVFLISSITNIIIGTYIGVSFLDFFLTVGIISLIIFVFTLIFFIFLYKNELVVPKEGTRVLKEFNAWNFVQNKALLVQSFLALVILITLFIVVPPSVISVDMIAMILAIVLIITSRLDPKTIFPKIDIELILYLLGIFLMVGALEIIGVIDAIAVLVSNIGGSEILGQILFILWVSAFLSAAIDNIPITKVLIPVVDGMKATSSNSDRNLKFYCLTIGANWGDNFTPLGDNILVMNVAEQHKRPISFKLFLKVGAVTVTYQLAIVSLIFILIFEFLLGLVIITSVISILLLFYLLYKISPSNLKQKIENGINKIRNAIIK